MTQHPIHTASPAELRGYALGLRETSSLLAITWAGTGMVDADDMSLLVTATREAWEREASLVEGFAARLEAAEAALAQALRDIGADEFRFSPESMAEVEAMLPPSADPPRPVTPERVAAWAARFEAAALRTVAQPAGADADFVPEEAAQTGLAEAVAESLATPPPAPEKPAPVQRSDSPWTEERVALLRRLFPTTMTLEGIRQALLALPGLDIATAAAVQVKAQKLDLHRRGAEIPEEYAGATPVRVKNLGSLAGNGAKPGTWTLERLEILRRDYPGKRPLEEVLSDVNALPGPPVPTTAAVAAKAKTMGLQRRQPPEVGPAIAPPPAIAAGMPMTTEDKAEALERLRKGVDKGAKDVMEYFGCSDQEALALVDQHRARMGRAA